MPRLALRETRTARRDRPTTALRACACAARATAGSRRSAPPAGAPATAFKTRCRASAGVRAASWSSLMGSSPDTAGRASRAAAPPATPRRRRRPGRTAAWPGTSLLQSGCPMSGRPAMMVVRSDWSLTSPRKEPSTTDPAFGPPVPPAPWQDAQNVANDRGAARRDLRREPAYGGGVAPAESARGGAQPRMPRTRTSTCASVSMPPALVREGRHQRAAHARRGRAADRRVVRDRQVHGVRETDRAGAARCPRGRDSRRSSRNRAAAKSVTVVRPDLDRRRASAGPASRRSRRRAARPSRRSDRREHGAAHGRSSPSFGAPSRPESRCRRAPRTTRTASCAPGPSASRRSRPRLRTRSA